ncbi:MAG: hypothetical protein KDB14_33570, partial [Planctomycetales bacterium]|nr:hypothetical protein [Planctomycetales bacterium]
MHTKFAWITILTSAPLWMLALGCSAAEDDIDSTHLGANDCTGGEGGASAGEGNGEAGQPSGGGESGGMGATGGSGGGTGGSGGGSGLKDFVTYLGGNDFEQARDVAVDKQGN